jgi:hypothetical protein
MLESYQEVKMKRLSWLAISVAILMLGAIFCANGGERHVTELKLESFDGGFFSIDKPLGWKVITAGACASFAFLIRDPSQPLKQVFYFGEVGPVYLSEQQRQIDYQYMSMGGYPSNWIDMPVVYPLTPGNFLKQFHLIAKSKLAQGFMPQFPCLENFKVISSVAQASPMSGATTELVRALFTQGGDLGEGLFLVTVAPMLPFTGGPGGGIGFGFCILGITAPQNEFPTLEATLSKSIASFSFNQSYVQNCMAQQNQTYQGILKAGKTLSEASDIIVQGWENRNKTDDILSEKYSDATLGRERLYDPNTGEVYEFENGFYDKYQLDQNKYEMNNLQPLPNDNHELWTKPTLDGHKHLR